MKPSRRDLDYEDYLDHLDFLFFGELDADHVAHLTRRS
jgi:hypothetical protein